MVLATDYLQTTNTAAPAIQARARDYIDKGLTRLLTFESPRGSGGFALWNGGEPQLFLTAFGLMQFVDMKRVRELPGGLLDRITTWIRGKQAADGSYGGGNMVHRWGAWKDTAPYMTAYVAWALARAGADASKSLAWLEPRVEDWQDPYGLALAALAFLEADPKSKTGQAIAKRLAEWALWETGEPSWQPKGSTFVGARGNGALLETTAVVTLALQKSGRHEDLVWGSLDTITSMRSADGRFGSTHSTALCLRALIGAHAGSEQLPTTKLAVLKKGEVVKHVIVPRGSTETLRVPLGTLDPRDVKVRMDGEGRMRATLTRTTHERWSETKLPKGPLALEVTWPEAKLVEDQAYTVRVRIHNTGKAKAKVVTAEIGLPPGLTVDPKQVTGEGLEEAELARRSLTLYLDSLAPGASRTFEIPFRTRFPFQARTAPSRVYEYYVEEEQTVVPPFRLVVGPK